MMVLFPYTKVGTPAMPWVPSHHVPPVSGRVGSPSQSGTNRTDTVAATCLAPLQMADT
jgi:hypothetical protein